MAELNQQPLGDPERILAAASQQLQAGRLTEARAAFLRVLETRPEDGDALHGLGLVYQRAGDAAKAAELLERAVQSAPTNAVYWTNLGAAQRDLEQLAAAIQSFRRSTELAPSHPMLLVNLGLALQDSGDRPGAEAAFRQALTVDPSCAEACNELGHLLTFHDPPAAMQALQAALRLRPGFEKAQVNLFVLLIREQQGAAALELAERRLAAQADDSYGIAQKAMALRELGRDGEADRLIDFERFLRTFSIEAPSGYADLEAFNRILLDHVRHHPGLTRVTARHATEHGRRVDNLLAEPLGPIPALQRRIAEAARAYWADLPYDPNHPFLTTSRPPRFRMHMWAVLLHRHGHEFPHFHPAGKLSGVYYVALPAVVFTDDETRQGWIEFGPPDLAYAARRAAPLRQHQPRAGDLVLFPSYFWHRTVPFDSEEERLSIAFDLILQRPGP